MVSLKPFPKDLLWDLKSFPKELGKKEHDLAPPPVVCFVPGVLGVSDRCRKDVKVFQAGMIYGSWGSVVVWLQTEFCVIVFFFLQTELVLFFLFLFFCGLKGQLRQSPKSQKTI